MDIFFLKSSFEGRTQGAIKAAPGTGRNGHTVEQELRVGKCFKIQGTDGTAWYQVTSVGPTSTEVEWRDYGIDRTMDEMLGAGGLFPRRVIQRLVRHHDTLEELFGESDLPLRGDPKGAASPADGMDQGI